MQLDLHPADLQQRNGHSLSVEMEPDKERAILIIKQFILRRERGYDRMKREVEVLDNLGNLDESSREPIPGAVRTFV
jgi:hypothetical protein